MGREFVAQQVFPRIELEQRADHPVLGIGKLTFLGQADRLQIGVMGAKARLARGPGQRLDGGVILGRVLHGGEMDVGALRRHHRPAFDQRLMDAVELVVALAQHAGGNLLFQPEPLERGAFIKRGRGVGVVFQQRRRPGAVIGQVHAAIEFGFAIAPAARDQIPMVARQAHARHQRFIGDDPVHGLAAQGVQFRRGVLDGAFDLGQIEFIDAGFVPIGFTMHIRKGEPQPFGLAPPVWAFRQRQLAHQRRRRG